MEEQEQEQEQAAPRRMAIYKNYAFRRPVEGQPPPPEPWETPLGLYDAFVQHHPREFPLVCTYGHWEGPLVFTYTLLLTSPEQAEMLFRHSHNDGHDICIRMKAFVDQRTKTVVVYGAHTTENCGGHVTVDAPGTKALRAFLRQDATRGILQRVNLAIFIAEFFQSKHTYEKGTVGVHIYSSVYRPGQVGAQVVALEIQDPGKSHREIASSWANSNGLDPRGLWKLTIGYGRRLRRTMLRRSIRHLKRTGLGSVCGCDDLIRHIAERSTPGPPDVPHAQYQLKEDRHTWDVFFRGGRLRHMYHTTQAFWGFAA